MSVIRRDPVLAGEASWSLGRLLEKLSRLPVLFALCLQGFAGLIQVTAFVRLHGSDYLDFSQAFLIGNVIAMLAVLNFENALLAGRFSRSVLGYFVGLWSIGFASLAFTLLRGGEIPSVVAFASWGVCLRLFLAWASGNTPRLAPILVAGASGVGAALSGNPALVMLVGMLAMALIGGMGGGLRAPADQGLGPVALGSARAYLRYLPHTIAGLAVGYLDRFVALGVVGGAPAEAYLRTVQVCAWGAFLCFPVVFELRSRALAAGAVTPIRAGAILGMLSGILALAVALILGALAVTGESFALDPWVLLAVFAGIALSQYYQVISTLNFVGDRFSTINRITLASAAIVLVAGLPLVFTAPGGLSLALMFLAGWVVQAIATSLSLVRPAGVRA